MFRSIHVVIELLPLPEKRQPYPSSSGPCFLEPSRDGDSESAFFRVGAAENVSFVDASNAEPASESDDVPCDGRERNGGANPWMYHMRLLQGVERDHLVLQHLQPLDRQRDGDHAEKLPRGFKRPTLIAVVPDPRAVVHAQGVPEKLVCGPPPPT